MPVPVPVPIAGQCQCRPSASASASASAGPVPVSQCRVRRDGYDAIRPVMHPNQTNNPIGRTPLRRESRRKASLAHAPATFAPGLEDVTSRSAGFCVQCAPHTHANHARSCGTVRNAAGRVASCVATSMLHPLGKQSVRRLCVVQTGTRRDATRRDGTGRDGCAACALGSSARRARWRTRRRASSSSRF